jgi:hypothetical protein
MLTDIAVTFLLYSVDAALAISLGLNEFSIVMSLGMSFDALYFKKAVSCLLFQKR